MTTISGFIVRETEKAVAFVQLPLTADMAPLWVPRKKIYGTFKQYGYAPSIQLKGEQIRRLGQQADLVVDTEWLAEIQEKECV